MSHPGTIPGATDAIVHLHAITWNEAEMLGFFFRHYDPWIDRYVIFDDGSTDGTLEALQDHPRVVVRKFQRSCPDSFVESARRHYNSSWKSSRGQAHWVVIAAVDEHLHVPGVPMRQYLEHCRAQGVTVVPALGCQMISDEFPAPDERLCDTRTWGAPWGQMNKLGVFDPHAIEDTGYEAGRHRAHPSGRVQVPDRDELLLLHYKYMGFERTRARHALLKTGLGPGDLSENWAHHYSWTDPQLRAAWEDFARQKVDVSRPDWEPWRNHAPARWWRT